ncbi:MAG: asparagine synthase (glutamine-hydrolyzing) [Bacteroidia bacterium]|nr:asparagine synthase (glutamine-hydrolyzing) [Bacteroidia bacterium]
MCGIAGLAGNFNSEESARLLRGMMDRMDHRGPDAEGSRVEEGVSLGHLRLAIVDLSEAGTQPMHDHSENFLLTFNGEIYNFKDIRGKLPAISYRSQTDTEVILEGFGLWGPAVFDQMNGMFAAAFWNKKQQELTLVRDRLGIKPLYYHISGGKIAFASEIRALIGTGLFKPTIDRDGLADFFTYQTVHAPKTILNEVKMLLPGHYLTFRNGKEEIKSFWRLEDQGQNQENGNYEAVKTRVRELLGAAVERRMMSDVPLGAFLSGGIDSSAVVALMAQASSQPIDTFSVVFQEKEYDESPWSEMMARKYQTRHHPILLKPDDFLEGLPRALQAMDHPSGDGINSFVVSGVTKKAGITVALSGLGGDELFAGYPVFRQLGEIQGSALWKLPAGLRKMLAPLVEIVPGGRRGEKLGALLRLSRSRLQDIYPVFRMVFAASEMRSISPGAHPDYNFVKSFISQQAASLEKIPALSQISLAEIRTYTQNVLLRDTDQMSMAHALEVRVPFFDHTLVEYLMGIPDRLKYPDYPKKLLVESMGDLLPAEVVHRKKMGFVFPWERWLREELRSFCEAKLNWLGKSSLFDEKAIQSLWKDFGKGKGSALWSHIWLLVVLADWMQKNGVEE